MQTLSQPRGMRFVGRAHDLIVKHLKRDCCGETKGASSEIQVIFHLVTHRKVQGKAKANRVGRRQILLGVRTRAFVSLEGFLGRFFSGFSALELGEVSVIVTLHLVVEDFALLLFGPRNQLTLDDAQDLARRKTINLVRITGFMMVRFWRRLQEVPY